MIEVTRLNGTAYFLNPDLIVTVESTPDTIITMTNGEKHMVKESAGVVVARFVKFKKSVMAGIGEAKKSGAYAASVDEG